MEYFSRQTGGHGKRPGNIVYCGFEGLNEQILKRKRNLANGDDSKLTLSAETSSNCTQSMSYRNFTPFGTLVSAIRHPGVFSRQAGGNGKRPGNIILLI